MYHYADYGPDRGAPLGPEPTLHDPVAVSNSDLGAWTELRPECRVHESTVGAYTYLMDRVQVDFATLGRFDSVASDVRVGPTNHPTERPTSHHFTYRAERYDLGSDDETVFAWRADDPVEVGHDVWIGHGATVLPGVVVGNGAVVAAGSVVTTDVEPYTVVAGVPAEQVGRRFPPDVATAVEATEWWSWDHETLNDRLADFRDIETFLEKYASKVPDGTSTAGIGPDSNE